MTITSAGIEGITPSGVPRPLMPYSPAVRAGDWLFVAGQMATDFVSGLAPDIQACNPNLTDTLEAETAFILDTLRDTVSPAGADLSRDAVRMWQWYTKSLPTQEQFDAGAPWTPLGVRSFEAAAGVLTGPRPAMSHMGIRELLVRDTTIEIDLICRLDGLENESVPAPDGWAGELSSDFPAVRRGDYVFISSQHGVSGEVVETASDIVVEAQVERALSKLAAIAQTAGTSLERAFKAEVYLGRPQDLPIVDRVWKRFFPQDPPARLVVPYMGLPEPGSVVEIALSLLHGSSAIEVITIETSDAPEAVTWEPQAVKVDDLIYFSTQMAVDSRGRLADGMERQPNFPYYGEPGRNQMRYVLDNVAAIAAAGGSSLENIVRRACFHDDYEFFQQCMNEFAVRFPEVKPASTTLGLTRGPLAVPGAKFLLDLIAYAPR